MSAASLGCEDEPEREDGSDLDRSGLGAWAEGLVLDRRRATPFLRWERRTEGAGVGMREGREGPAADEVGGLSLWDTGRVSESSFPREDPVPGSGNARPCDTTEKLGSGFQRGGHGS